MLIKLRTGNKTMTITLNLKIQTYMNAKWNPWSNNNHNQNNNQKDTYVTGLNRSETILPNVIAL